MSRLTIILVALWLFTAPTLADVRPQDEPTATPCTPTELEPGEHWRTLFSDGIDRSYILYIPESLDAESPVPLLVGFHGFGQTGAAFLSLAGWRAVAEEQGFILVAPEGVGLAWNTGLQGNIIRSSDIADDVLFFQDLRAELDRLLCIDPARVYLAGFSNGGGMVERLACEYAEQIAAVGTVAGAVNWDFETCQPEHPVPLIAFSGLADRVVPYAGNDDLGLPAVEDWISSWAERDGCSLTPTVEPITDDVEQTMFTDCAAPVVLYTIDAGQHSWPGGTPSADIALLSSTNTIDASALMWAFFTAQADPSAE